MLYEVIITHIGECVCVSMFECAVCESCGYAARMWFIFDERCVRFVMYLYGVDSSCGARQRVSGVSDDGQYREECTHIPHTNIHTSS